MDGHALLDKAAKMCGSRYKLAKRLGLSESYLSHVHTGRAALSPEVAARLADIAGVDARSAALVAMVEGQKDPTLAEELKRVFGLATAAAMLVFFIGDASTEPSLITDAAVATSQSAPEIYADDSLPAASVYYVNCLIAMALIICCWKYTLRGPATRRLQHTSRFA